MPRGNAESNRSAVILHVDAEFLEAKGAEEQLFDIRGQLVEGVLELTGGRLGTEAEADIVRCNHVEAVREFGDQVAKHVRGGGEAVQQHDGRRVLGASLAIENVQSVDGRISILSHWVSPGYGLVWNGSGGLCG